MKSTFTVILLLCLGNFAFGQWSLKPTVGVNITDASQDTETHEAKGKVGWQFGASALIGRKFYVEPGVFFQQQSLDFISSVDPELDLEHTASGFRVPVSVGYHLLGGEDTDLNIRIFGGGSGFFVTKTTGNIEKEDVPSPQWGVYAGAGVDFWLMFIDLKYQWSLTDITSVTQFDVGQTRSFFANIGFRFRFK
jgi:Outer membrane protein beta-barrel domain